MSILRQYHDSQARLLTLQNLHRLAVLRLEVAKLDYDDAWNAEQRARADLEAERKTFAELEKQMENAH